MSQELSIPVEGRVPSNRCTDLTCRVLWDSQGFEIRVDDRNCPEFWLAARPHYHVLKFLMERIEAARPKCGCTDREPGDCRKANPERASTEALIGHDIPCDCGCHVEQEDGMTDWDRESGDLREEDPEFADKLAAAIRATRFTLLSGPTQLGRGLETL